MVDPVVRSTSGFDLIDDEALRMLIEKLFPLSRIITPNIVEAERIAEIKIRTAADIEKAARRMQSFGAKNVLIKGGHLPDSFFTYGKANVNEQPILTDNSANTRSAVDYLFTGNELHICDGEYIETDSTHGTGCTLAAAIAANLALGKTLVEAVKTAKRFVTEAIRTAPGIGKGHSPVNSIVSDF